MRLLLAALAIALLLLGVEEYRIQKRDRQLDAYKVEFARADERYKAKDREYREQEEQIRVKHKEIYDEQQAQIDKLQVVIARERKSSSSLRDAFSSYRCPEATGDSKTGSQGPSEAGDMRSYVFGRIDEAAGTIGGFAEEAMIAYETCVKEYQAVRLLIR